MFTLTTEQMSENADVAKVSVLRALVADGVLSEARADEWAQTHAVLCRTKYTALFRGLFKRLERADDAELWYEVVARHVAPTVATTDGEDR